MVDSIRRRLNYSHYDSSTCRKHTSLLNDLQSARPPPELSHRHIIDLRLSTNTTLCFFVVGGSVFGRWPFGDTIRKIQGSLTFFFASFSLLNTIAINRYVKMATEIGEHLSKNVH